MTPNHYYLGHLDNIPYDDSVLTPAERAARDARRQASTAHVAPPDLSDDLPIPEAGGPGDSYEPPEPRPPCDARRPCIARLSDVRPVEVDWLWSNRIPLGRITVLAGRPGCGKSLLTVDMAARVSTGRDWPDGSYCPLGSVLMLAAEDALDDTIRPRLDAARADCTRIIALTGVTQEGDGGKSFNHPVTLLFDLDMIEATIASMGDCRLLVIDPVGSYLGRGTDSHRDNEVRAVLTPLADLAQKLNFAVVVVCHTRKGGSASHADDAVLGSVGFAGIARSVLHSIDDTSETEHRRKLLLPGKNNLAPPTPGWSFTVEGSPPHVVWGERVEQHADDVMRAASRPGPDDTALREAVEWLSKALAAGPRLAKEVQADANEAAGITVATLRRAQRKLGVVPTRPKNPGPWWWELPS